MEEIQQLHSEVSDLQQHLQETNKVGSVNPGMPGDLFQQCRLDLSSY